MLQILQKICKIGMIVSIAMLIAGAFLTLDPPLIDEETTDFLRKGALMVLGISAIGLLILGRRP